MRTREWRPQFPTRRADRVAFGPGRPSRRGRHSEHRLRRRRRGQAMLGPGVTRRHHSPDDVAPRTSDAESGVPAPGGSRPGGTKAIRRDRASSATARGRA